MEYHVTFEDGSDGYLAHHGVLGMHWGIRNSETERKYASGQDHSEARTDIKSMTKGHAYQGRFKPSLSNDQVKMLKRAATGVAIGAGLAAGVVVGSKTGVLKTVAKHGAKKLANTRSLQNAGKNFVSKVRSSKKVTLSRKTALQRQLGNKHRAIKAAPKKAVTRIKNSKPVVTARRLNKRFDYYTKDPVGKKKAANRLALGASGAALASVPFVEGRSIDKRELRRKNGRHASTKWMRNKERKSQAYTRFV